MTEMPMMRGAPRGRTIAAALLLAALSSTAMADDRTDGIWEGLAEAGDGSLSLKATFIGDAGELRMVLDRRGTHRCRYSLRLEGDAVAAVFPVANLSSPTCPTDMTVTFGDRDGPVLPVSMEGSGRLYEDLPETGLRRRIGPVPADERATIPAELDILGARVGMTRSEVEAKLVGEHGFEEIEARRREVTDTGYAAETVHYAFKADFEDASLSDDIVAVVFEGGADREAAASDDARAVLIRRRWETHPERGLTIPVLEQAVAEKYGAGETSRLYGRDGALAGSVGQEARLMLRPRAHCSTAMRAAARETVTFEYRVSIPGEAELVEANVFALCGSYATIQIANRYRNDTGTRHPVLDITIANYDLMNDEVWKRYAARLGPDLAADLAKAAVSAGGTEEAEPARPRL